MAAVRETPRQRMIGMMYLVLTALLALNVSSAVIEKFVLINQSMEETIHEKVSLNKGVLDRIEKTVSDAGNREKDMEVLGKAKVVSQKSEQVLKKVEAYKAMFIKTTGGRDEHGNYVGTANVDQVATLMVQKKGGEVLEKELNAYSKFLRDEIGDATFHDIARDAKDVSIFKNDPEQSIKDFADLNFGYNTPMAAGLAVLSVLAMEVLDYEGRALEDLARSVGAEDVKFDRIVAMVRPESQVVAAGAKYRAEIFVAASSSAVDPLMFVDDRPVEVVDGKGRVEFTATPGNYNSDGVVEKSYDATVKVRGADGEYKEYKNRQLYYVARPVIQIQSASVQALYFNCGNELDVQVPSLGSSYNPTFSVSGGQFVRGGTRGLITIIPKDSKVLLTVRNEGNLIGTQDFKVRLIPKPEIRVYSGAREVDQKKGLAKAPRSLQLRAVPDESFAQFLPKDARFKVMAAEVALVRGGRAVKIVQAKSDKLIISSLANEARSGDAIVIEVKKVARRNFRGEVEDFSKFSPRVINIRIN